MLTSLRSLLRGAAKSLGVERAAFAALIAEMWPEIVGPEASAHSRPIGLRGSVLLAEAETGLWAQELSARRGGFAAEINRRLGAPAVAEIRFKQVAGWRTPPAGDAPQPADAPTALTAEESASVERAAAEIADPEVREAAKKAMRSQIAWRKRHVRPPGR
jgi:hypothetical protein